MPLAGDDKSVARRQHGNGGLDGFRPVGDLDGVGRRGEYFRARPAGGSMLLEELEERLLPELPVIRDTSQWDEALDSALGPALKRAWEEERGVGVSDQ